MEKTSNATSEKTSEPTADAEAAIILAMCTGRRTNRPSEERIGLKKMKSVRRGQRPERTEHAKVIMEMINLG